MIRKALEEAIADLAWVKDERALGLMAQHWALVIQWNVRVNLTSIEDPVEAAWLHYRDSLEGVRFLVNGAVTDIGSGAGFPGIPLAIVEPDRSVQLVEPRRKRASFLRTVCARLGLENVSILETRVEATPPIKTPNVVTRATFSQRSDIERCKQWVLAPGRFLAYRSDESGADDSVTHEYFLRGKRKLIEAWSVSCFS